MFLKMLPIVSVSEQLKIIREVDRGRGQSVLLNLGGVNGSPARL